VTDGQIIAARCGGMKVKDILAGAGMDPRDVYSVLRRAGMCRDQRPLREYVCTVMVPEIVRVRAVSVAQARETARERYNGNVRVASVVETKE